MQQSLNKNQVHIWVADLDSQDYDPVRKYLSPIEQARADRFRFQKDRAAYEKARGVLRFLLGNYFRTNPADIEILTTELGKPYVSKLLNKQILSFNLSHASGLGIYAFTLNHSIGIDVENLRAIPNLEELAARFFSANEQESLRVADPSALTKLFLQYWVRKEAYLKALGLGLSISPEEVDVSFPPIPSPQLTLFQPKIISDPNIWSLMDFFPTDESVAALVVDAGVTQIELIRVNPPA